MVDLIWKCYHALEQAHAEVAPLDIIIIHSFERDMKVCRNLVLWWSRPETRSIIPNGQKLLIEISDFCTE